ncbi:MAG TPA: hypothetical protein VJI15_00415 [Candidatus Nanoarchaeia archaeon]|nr:hypothetical protein [Candidatus Nanoarchaeia archaeon]
MVNPWYVRKEQEIKSVLEREGFIILFDFLEKEELKELKRRKKSPAKKVNKVLQGVYAESSFSWHDGFLQKIVGRRIPWKAMEFSRGDYLIRNDHTSLKKGTYALFNLDEGDDISGGYAVFLDAEGNHLRVPSTKNALTIVKNPKSWYVKYVNCLSRGKRRFLMGSTRN